MKNVTHLKTSRMPDNSEEESKEVARPGKKRRVAKPRGGDVEMERESSPLHQDVPTTPKSVRRSPRGSKYSTSTSTQSTSATKTATSNGAAPGTLPRRPSPL